MVDPDKYLDLIGVPYRIKGRGPHEFDCYGLIGEMYRRVHGSEVPPLDSPQSFELMEGAAKEFAATSWKQVEKKPGCVALIRVGRYLSHVGFVLDNNRMIHCWEGSKGVVIERIDQWERRIVGYYHYE